jgi:hypothetical protein
MEDLSFKDRILAYAEGHGLKFTPRPGKFYNGVPVYEFGCVRIRLDSCIFAALCASSRIMEFCHSCAIDGD